MVLIRVWFRKHALQWIALRWRRQPTLLSLLHLNPSNHTTYRLTPPKRPPPTFTGDGRFLFPCYFYRDAAFILPHADNIAFTILQIAIGGVSRKNFYIHRTSCTLTDGFFARCLLRGYFTVPSDTVSVRTVCVL